MKPELKDFLLRIGAAFVIALVLAPVFGVIFDSEPFHRVMTRCFLITLVVALALGAGHPGTWPAKLAAMGLRGPHRIFRFGYGVGVALLLVTGLLLVSWLLGGRVPPEQPFHRALLIHFLIAAARGCAVGLFEETICRGYLKDLMGGPASALVYAVVHYFKPASGSAPAGPDYDPLLAIKRLPELFEGLGHPQNMTLGVFGLFLFGMALNRLRERTGNLYVGIGLHAGLVFALDFFRRVLSDVPDGSYWIFGGGRLYDGVLGNLMLLILLVLAYKAPIRGRLSN